MRYQARKWLITRSTAYAEAIAFNAHAFALNGEPDAFLHVSSLCVAGLPPAADSESSALASPPILGWVSVRNRVAAGALQAVAR